MPLIVSGIVLVGDNLSITYTNTLAAEMPIPADQNMQELVTNYLNAGTKQGIIDKYGIIDDWNTSKVTNMNAMFYEASAFNQDISGWDVSKVTNMNAMFYNASAFNPDISGWDVGNVKNMRSMFNKASAFNQNISEWDVRNVIDAYFFGADSPLCTDASVNPPNFNYNTNICP